MAKIQSTGFEFARPLTGAKRLNFKRIAHADGTHTNRRGEIRDVSRLGRVGLDSG
jgi:hypothetical protein